MTDPALGMRLPPTGRQKAALAAFVETGGIRGASQAMGVQPSTVKRHLADLRARTGLTTEQLIYVGRAVGWLVVPDLESLKPNRGCRLIRPSEFRETQGRQSVTVREGRPRV